MRAFDEQIVVHRAEDRAETIGIVPIPRAAVVFGMQAIGERRAKRRKAFEKTGRAARFQGDRFAAGKTSADLARARDESADDRAAALLMRTENAERIGMKAGDEGGGIPDRNLVLALDS